MIAHDVDDPREFGAAAHRNRPAAIHGKLPRLLRGESIKP
jgi:hypothetical protein